MRVAHITAHTGGGVGAVLKGFFEISKARGLDNELFCLDFCRSNFLELAGMSSGRDGLANDSKLLFVAELEQYDLVLVHYWNHPLMTKFLAEVRFPRTRVVVWSHNSGLFEPHLIPEYLADLASKVLFTSSCSFAAPNLQDLIRKVPETFGAVHSTRSLDEFTAIGAGRQTEPAVRTLLYVGTVSDSKMHPQSAEILSRLSRIGFRVKVVGSPDQSNLARRVSELGGDIETFGEVADVLHFYRTADAFIYPLRKDHYGTGEQVMLEAMASGLPVIAFSNPAESAVLGYDGGVLVDTAEQFVSALVNLDSNPELYQAISRNAKRRVLEEFDATQMVERLVECFSGLTNHDKAEPTPLERKYGHLDGLALYVLNSFLRGESLVDEITTNREDAAEIVFSKIEPHLRRSSDALRWFDSSKSTPFHYLGYFPESTGLKALCMRISAVKNRSHLG